ncbi:MAG: YARHG domain-containing protein, partial [Chitinophagaceae bacterium]
MALNLNKGSLPGKYYFKKHGNAFGPFLLEDLLPHIAEDTPVSGDGYTWKRANDFDVLRNFLATPAPAESTTYALPPELQDGATGRNSKTWIWHCAAGALVLLIFLVTRSGPAPEAAREEPAPIVAAATDTVVNTPPPPPEEAIDVYTSILSARALTDGDLSSLAITELIAYRDEMLARHGYNFEEGTGTNNFAGMPWYQPRYNRFVAESDLSPLEKQNYDLLNLQIHTKEAALQALIQQYYGAISAGTFDASNFYDNAVQQYIGLHNVSIFEVNQDYVKYRDDFTKPVYHFSEPMTLLFEEMKEGILYFRFSILYEVNRPSKGKMQTCLTTVRWGVNSANKLVYYNEVKLENLRFTPLPEETAPVADTTS